jgi:bifunctional non-homologous end joining protein LigD
MDLQKYRRKRNFSETPEPRGKKSGRKAPRLSFAVQKHAARRLHYDFRLEMGGVLASWAVPKGPSTNPKERRLAVQVEDHPVEYGDFEGVIPAGQYGAGRVIVWDRGTWRPEKNPLDGLRRGRLKFQLLGKKLQGGWTLVRMNGKNRGDKNWLLIKERDNKAHAQDVEAAKPASVKSGLTIEAIGERRQPVRSRPTAPNPTRLRTAVKNARKSRMADFYPPQLATLVDRVPGGDEWLHEIKFDGYRILAHLDHGQVKLLTREAHDWTARFKSCADAVRRLPAQRAFLDGEIAALREDGTSDFQLLQNSLREHAPTRLVYFVFDLLYLDGADLRATPLRQRKEKLQKLLAHAPEGVRYSEHWSGQGDELFQKACASGLEGIISKRGDQQYQPRRSGDWLKIKCVRSQEFIIAGYTDPAGSRSNFGALLLGVYENNGALRYAGRVGTGFTDTSLRDLHARMDKLKSEASPFAEALPRRQTKGVHWIKPELVCEVAFTGWTEDKILRHPSFKGLREDKPPVQIRREKETPLAEAARSTSGADSEIAGVSLTHPDRILYPEQKITKLDLAHYYEAIAERMLPHVSDRPLTLLRCPEGYGESCFYQRHSRESLDPAIHALRVKEKKSGSSYLAIDSLAGLIALVQLGALEIHTWQARAQAIERPDQIIFDLDPDPALSWKPLKDAALELRKRLSNVGLNSFVKTTGGKGLHVVVPLEPKQGWKFVKEFTHAVAQSVVGDEPDRYTATLSKAKRKGKIFIDYLRNAKTASAVCVYSTRARAGAPVSMPLRREDLKTDPRGEFDIQTAPKHAARLRRDSWADFERARVPLDADMLKRF